MILELECGTTAHVGFACFLAGSRFLLSLCRARVGLLVLRHRVLRHPGWHPGLYRPRRWCHPLDWHHHRHSHGHGVAICLPARPPSALVCATSTQTDPLLRLPRLQGTSALQFDRGFGGVRVLYSADRVAEEGTAGELTYPLPLLGSCSPRRVSRRVEFQNKFYKALGYPFEPLDFNKFDLDTILGDAQ